MTGALAPGALSAANVTLGWDPNAEPEVKGYNVYYGPSSRHYTVSNNVGNVSSISISNLINDATYYFAVTAYDSSGLESDPSDEVSYPPDAVVPTNAPVNVVIDTVPNGAAFVASDDITLTASVTAPDGAISKIEFFADATKLGEDTVRPYRFVWSDVPAGNYSLTAAAIDPAGVRVVSAPLTIDVSSPFPPPAIVTHPKGRSAVIGSNTIFAVVATGIAPLNYRWRFKGTNLSDSTNVLGSAASRLLLASVSPLQAGQYSVVVTSPSGVVTSQLAVLTVVRPPPQMLTINASNAVAVPVVVTPADLKGQDDGPSPLTRSYDIQSRVTVTAPPSSGLSTFVKWQRDGVDYTNMPTAVLVMDSPHALTAIFSSGVPPRSDASRLHLELTRRATDGRLRLMIYSATGAPLDPLRLERVNLLASDLATQPIALWSKLGSRPLPTNGLAEFAIPTAAERARRYYQLVEGP